MAAERFIETGKGTFYGEYIYDQGVPKEHFLRKLNHTGFAGINGWISAMLQDGAEVWGSQTLYWLEPV